MSADLRDLLENMICRDPKNRLSLASIIAHPWMQRPTDSTKRLSEELSSRLEVIDPAKEATRQARVKANSKIYMSTGEEEKVSEQRTEVPALTSRKLNILYSEAHPVVLM